jgi:hypothetical protein
LRGYGANHRAFDAPVASGDGRVTIFNTKDLFADPGAASLQAIDLPPGLPSWLTPVGSSYRFAATTPVTRTILFQYVEREVPRGYEHTLSIYHLPADGSGWQKLPTLIDGVQNLAVTRMPDDQHLGQGVYALIAAVEMPPLQPGWNLFAYTVPQTRTVDVALRSIEGAYDMVYRYRPDDRRWLFYDANVEPEMAAAVNTLSTMEFGQIYLVHATATVTPYLAIAAGDPAPAGLADLASVPQLPPATLFGAVRGIGSYLPAAGSTIAAYVGDTLCGESELVAQGEKLLYQLQVMAAAEMVQCGVPGAPVRLTVDGRPAAAEVLWDNLRSTRQDLEVP